METLQWMGAVRMRVQTADKNITIIHTIMDVFIKSIIQINYFFSQKIVPSKM